LFIDATFFPYLSDISGEFMWTFLCIIHYCHHLLMYENTKWAAILWYLIHNWVIEDCAVLFYKIYTDNNILSIVNRSTVIYRPVHSPVSHACVRHQHYNIVSYFKANVVYIKLYQNKNYIQMLEKKIWFCRALTLIINIGILYLYILYIPHWLIF